MVRTRRLGCLLVVLAVMIPLYGISRLVRAIQVESEECRIALPPNLVFLSTSAFMPYLVDSKKVSMPVLPWEFDDNIGLLSAAKLNGVVYFEVRTKSPRGIEFFRMTPQGDFLNVEDVGGLSPAQLNTLHWIPIERVMFYSRTHIER